MDYRFHTRKHACMMHVVIATQHLASYTDSLDALNLNILLHSYINVIHS